MVKLKKIDKKEKLVRKILAAARKGKFIPGDRLQPIAKMVKETGYSQRVVMAAIDELADMGYIEKRFASGNYITENIRKLQKEEEATEPTKETKEESRSAEKVKVIDPNFYLLPPQTTTLNFYVTGIYREQLDFWRLVFSDIESQFHDLKINMLTYEDGHLTDLVQKCDLDLWVSTPEVTQTLPPDSYAKFNDLSHFNVKGDHLIPPVKQVIQQKARLNGVPFGLSTLFLYSNQALLKNHFPATTSIPRRWNQLIEWTNQAFTNSTDRIVQPLILYWLYGMALITGSIRLDNQGQVKVNLEASSQMIDQLIAAVPQRAGDMFGHSSGLNHFLHQEIAMLYSWLPDLHHLEESGLQYHVDSLPTEGNGVIPGRLEVICVAQKNQYHRGCYQVIDHLLNPGNQQRYLQCGLPILQCCYDKQNTQMPYNLKRGTIHETFNKCQVFWPENNDWLEVQLKLSQLGRDIVNRQTSKPQAMERILRLET